MLRSALLPEEGEPGGSGLSPGGSGGAVAGVGSGGIKPPSGLRGAPGCAPGGGWRRGGKGCL